MADVAREQAAIRAENERRADLAKRAADIRAAAARRDARRALAAAKRERQSGG